MFILLIMSIPHGRPLAAETLAPLYFLRRRRAPFFGEQSTPQPRRHAKRSRRSQASSYHPGFHHPRHVSEVNRKYNNANKQRVQVVMLGRPGRRLAKAMAPRMRQRVVVASIEESSSLIRRPLAVRADGAPGHTQLTAFSPFPALTESPQTKITVPSSCFLHGTW
ncbi:hypothetical protein BDY21DRAFT_330881 [Lineolata rhizophorae]|uniref:Uncharacterized protein n=1 Tax=Lineolata rhizophorae TaxID=578093 RepID=A0A6A6PEJ1_9PEZI|nr:hypothetical protein BDY21DRAFT_330881 [Lineolata rhizophorae]